MSSEDGGQILGVDLRHQREFCISFARSCTSCGEWICCFDMAILATFMGVPKEGPSAGIALVVGIITALKGLPVRNDLAMTGEITILDKVLPVGGIQQKLQAACEAGVKEVVIPNDNLTEAQTLPAAITQKLEITPVQVVDEAIKAALIVPKAWKEESRYVPEEARAKAYSFDPPHYGPWHREPLGPCDP